MGPTFLIYAEMKEIDFMEQFFSPELYQRIVTETNRRGNDDDKFVDTNVEEIKRFIGIHILMGIMDLPSYKLYWSTEWLLRTSVPNIMTRHRFEKLMQYFHVVNEENKNPNDKLWKVRPVYDKVLKNCQEKYNPHCEISVDEAMVGFNGRLGFKQYMPLKPTKFGIKIWVRADAHNGFTSSFQCYTGREKNAAGKPITEQGLSSRVVRDMVKGLERKHHHVYMDNYFTSVLLFCILLQLGVYATGTVRTNRKGWPKQLPSKCVKRQGEYKQAQKENLTACTWFDKRQVNLLSTVSNPLKIEKVSRRQKDGSLKDIDGPEIVVLYGKYMGGVDRSDQLRSLYSVSRKSLRWWRYVFWWLLDTSIVNGYILMRESPRHELFTRNKVKKDRTLLSFRLALANQLIGKIQEVRMRKRSIETVANPRVNHWPMKMATRSRCVYCHQVKHERHESMYQCTHCRVHLCITCFQPYHSG